jgi:D-alanyl-D-alanine endopeptidase (penicillin-binding protein 7)
MVAASFSSAAFAQTIDEGGARANLHAIYEQRPDLQALFSEDGTLRPDAATAVLPDLDTWARKYGRKEYPELLAWYAPAVSTDEQPAVLPIRNAALAPTKVAATRFDPASVTARKFLVLDDASGKVLLSKDAESVHPIASITKLMTAMIAVDRAIPSSRKVTMLAGDELGGARLRVKTGARLSFQDLMYAMLVGSANNAAAAVARSTGLGKVGFVAEMNRRAEKLGLTHTRFADPSGLDPRNVSTPSEIAAMAMEAWKRRAIRKYTSTAKVTVHASGVAHPLTNTDWLLTDPDNGLFVLGGKTGYLEDSLWNFVVRMRDATHPTLVIVVFGSNDRQASFDDATRLAKWSWENYSWK